MVRAWGLESHHGSPSLSEEWTHCRQFGHSRWSLQSVAAESEEGIDDLLPSSLEAAFGDTE